MSQANEHNKLVHTNNQMNYKRKHKVTKIPSFRLTKHAIKTGSYALNNEVLISPAHLPFYLSNTGILGNIFD